MPDIIVEIDSDDSEDFINFLVEVVGDLVSALNDLILIDIPIDMPLYDGNFRRDFL